MNLPTPLRMISEAGIPNSTNTANSTLLSYAGYRQGGMAARSMMSRGNRPESVRTAFVKRAIALRFEAQASAMVGRCNSLRIP